MKLSVSIGANALVLETADDRWSDALSVFTAFLNAFKTDDQAAVNILANTLKTSTDQLERAVEAQKE